jgi:hypothetical protein
MQRIAAARELPGRGLLHLEGLDAAPNACVDLPFLLAYEMCKDTTCISDLTH